MIKLYHKLFIFATCLMSVGLAVGQNAGPIPFVKSFWTDNNGQPLAGGLVFSYLAGSSTPTSTFTDSTMSTANPNPVVLDSAGRANIWLNPAVSYKIVLQNSLGVTQWSVDGVYSLVQNSGPWGTSGNNIYNTNSGFVGVGCGPSTTLSKLDVCGSSSGSNYLVRIDDSASSPGINLFGNGGTLLGSIAADASVSFRVRDSGNSTQLVISPNGDIIQNSASGGSTHLVIANGVSQSGHLVSFDDSSLAELAFIDLSGEFAAPLFNSTGNSGGFTFQNSNSTFLVDNTGDVTFSGLLQAAAVFKVTSAGDTTVHDLTVTGTCTGCGGGGGGSTPGTPVNSVQFNNPLGTFAGSANFTYTEVSGNSTLTVGTTSSTGGIASNGTSTAAFNAPLGGLTAKYLIGSTSLTILGDTAVNAGLSAAGSGRIYFDSTSNQFLVSQNGNAYAPLGAAGCTVNCMTTDTTQSVTGTKTFTTTLNGIGFNASNTGSNLVFNSLGFTVDGNGFVNETNASGAVLAAGYVDTNQWYGMLRYPSTAPTAVVGAGYGAWGYKGGTSGLVFWVYDSVHSAWSAVDLAAAGGTGITSINGQTGAAQTIAGTAGQITATTTSDTVTISLPSTITTANHVATAAFNSTIAAGTGTAYTVTNGLGNPFIVNGNGDVNINGAFTSLSGTGIGAFRVGSTTVIDGSRNGIFVGMTVSGISGSTQCVQASSAGVLSGTGSACGSGGGAVSSVTAGTNMVVSPTTGAVVVNTSANPSFTSVTATASGGTHGFDLNGNSGFWADGQGDVYADRVVNAVGVGGSAYQVNGTTIVDNSRNISNILQATAGEVVSTASGSSTAFLVAGGNFAVLGSGAANFFGQIYTNGGIQMGSWPTGGVTVLDGSRNAYFLTEESYCSGCTPITPVLNNRFIVAWGEPLTNTAGLINDITSGYQQLFSGSSFSSRLTAAPSHQLYTFFRDGSNAGQGQLANGTGSGGIDGAGTTINLIGASGTLQTFGNIIPGGISTGGGPGLTGSIVIGGCTITINIGVITGHAGC